VNLFDTMIAARILGEPQVGLGSLLDTYFEIKVDKRFQRANWGLRPLTRVMLDYARMDTHYLFDLKSLLEEQLKQRDLWELAKEDFNILCNVEPPTIETNGKSCWKICGSTHINGRQAAILQSLCTYRDQQARKMDLPHFKVFSNAFLVDLCKDPPHTLEELGSKRGVTERILKRHGANLLRAVQQGEDSPPLNRQPRTRPNENYVKRLEKLKEWRKLKAQDLKIESDIVIPKDIMEKIAAFNPKNKGDLYEIMNMTPWRYKHYGDSILNELSGLEE
jgi:ribonuclease D